VIENAVRTLRAALAALLRRPPGGIAVWDPGIRIFHWLLAAAVLADGLTGFLATRSGLAIHLAAGTLLAALLVWRVLWGLLGPGHARFATFAYHPRTVLAHARALLAGHGRRYVGHNPLGAMMVFALLAVLAAIVATGTIALGGMFKQGPLAFAFAFRPATYALGLHNFLAGLLVAMITAHLAGIAFGTWRERENLVGAMLTGVKTPNPGEPPPPHHARTRLAITLAVLLLAGGTWGAASLAARPARGVPPATLDPVYARECGACHFAYPPSLAPASAWRGIMAHLDRHFGEDAGLDAATAAHIAAYLAANSAEHWDTLPAVRLAGSFDPRNPLRITASGLWRRMHGHIPARIFASREVGGRGQCSACHADAASGLFAPQNIAIPEDAE
jgi:cytochrome b